MICFCYPDCTPVCGCFNLVQVLNAPEKSSSPSLSLLARSQLLSRVDAKVGAAAWCEQNQRKPRPPCLHAPWCTLQLLRHGAGRPGTRVPSPTPCSTSISAALTSRDGEGAGQQMLREAWFLPAVLGRSQGTQGPIKPPSLCGPAACTGCEWEGFVFKVSGDLRLWMQPRSRLGVSTRAFVFLLFFLVPCSMCTFASSQQRAILTSAYLEMKWKLLLDKLFKYLFLFKGTLWTSQLNKI